MSHKSVLSKRDLKSVRREVVAIASKWYDVGLELDLSADELDAIKKANRDNPQDCLRDLLRLWLSRVDTKPTWRALSNALTSPAVNEQALADTIERKHCKLRPSNIESSLSTKKVCDVMEDSQASPPGKKKRVFFSKKVRIITGNNIILAVCMFNKYCWQAQVRGYLGLCL